jgi:hypothetical protein
MGTLVAATNFNNDRAGVMGPGFRRDDIVIVVPT